MDLIEYFKSRQEEMVSLLKEIVIRESPSTDKKAVDICSSFVAKELKKIGAKITRFPQKQTGDLYLAEYPSEFRSKEGSQLLVLTHIDTVWPVGKIKEMPFQIKRNKVFGPGVLDMKIGLVVALFSLRYLKEMNIHPKRKIAVFINSAEEIESHASYQAIQKLAKESAYVLCLEPALPGGALKIQRKGRLVIRMEAKGKAAHAGTPEKGTNAVEELMLQLRQLQKIRTKSISFNIGLIGGGEKVNIVAEKAWAVLDIRFWNIQQKKKIMSFLKQLVPQLKGAQIRFSTESFTPPMEKTKASSDFFRKVKKIAESLGMTLEAGKTGGGSDASIASGMGIPTLDGLGPDGDGIHAENEHLILSSLPQRTALFTEIISQL
ncbi:MAG: M20 family metallopeptidase [Candidatus Aminicenantes bacterium]|nr:MAG: M20 family metallopeptidase [Candidatus Aminicenantes bacterium]